MKTYILDSINRFKRFSEKLDVATTLSNKTWVVFNDSGERELYIFQTDGTVIITKDGVGIKGKWQWLPENKSLIISQDNSVVMLHPQYIDQNILALQLDGKSDIAFLIEDANRIAFAPKTLAQLEQYFEKKVLQAIEAQKVTEHKNIQKVDNEKENFPMTQEEKERAEFRRKIEDEKIQEEEKKRKDKEWENWLRKEAEEINAKLRKPVLPEKQVTFFEGKYNVYLSIAFIIGYPFSIFESVWLSDLDEFIDNKFLSLLLYLLVLVLVLVIIVFLLRSFHWIYYRINKPKKDKLNEEWYREEMRDYNDQYEKYKIKRDQWIKEHPDDHRIKYL